MDLNQTKKRRDQNQKIVKLQGLITHMNSYNILKKL